MIIRSEGTALVGMSFSLNRGRISDSKSPVM